MDRVRHRVTPGFETEQRGEMRLVRSDDARAKRIARISESPKVGDGFWNSM
jgi:hypothetical protein